MAEKDPKAKGINVGSLSSEELKDKAEQILSTPEVQEKVEQGRSFYEEHKQTIGILLIVAGAYKLHKHAVRKVVTKVIQETPVNIDVPAFAKTYEEWWRAGKP